MLITNCLTKEECEIIENSFFKHIKNYPDGNNDKMRPLIALGLPNIPFKEIQIDHGQIISRLSNLVKENYTTNYKFNRSFLRIYYKDSLLRLHNDHKDINLTLSVNIGGIENWPLHISNIHTEDNNVYPECLGYEKLCNKFKKDYHSAITPKGCGVFWMGREYAHWRDPLQCEPDEYVIQIFFHWTKV